MRRHGERALTTLMNYAQLANNVYNAQLHKGATLDTETIGVKTTWKVTEWRAATTEGFQGAIFESGEEIVCAFKGTGASNTDDGGGTMWEDIKADARLTFWMKPKQLAEAAALAKVGKFLGGASKKPLSIVGHSLGGALAQGVGHTTGLPFVTFNAPGMRSNMAFTDAAAKIRGFNFILVSDPIGNFGFHVGETERFRTPWMFIPGPGGWIAHSMTTVLNKLKDSPKWAKKTIDELC